MAISTLDQYIASVKQRAQIVKTATRTTVGGNSFSMFDIAGQPGAGVLAGTSTTVPVMPTDATVGCPPITFSSGDGYITRIEFNNGAASRLALFDMLSKSGAYAYTAGTTTISTPLDISSRCPDLNGGYWGGSNEIWIEVSTSFVTGTAWSVVVTYTNQSGTTGRSTIAHTGMAAATLTIGKTFQLALAAGDSGVQKIESVIVTNGGTAMTAGAFNVLIHRPLWTSGRVPVAFYGDIHDMLKTGMPLIYNSSALYFQVMPDSTNTGLPEINVEIASA